jgi:hypothetical protein
MDCSNTPIASLSKDNLKIHNCKEPIYHITISNKFREYAKLGFKLANKLSNDDLYKYLSKTLEEVNNNYMSYLALIKKTDENNDDNSFCLTYVCFYIPKQLIERLVENKMYNCIFYIGLEDDKNKILISSIPPSEEKLAKHKKTPDDDNLPYKSTLLTFELTE